MINLIVCENKLNISLNSTKSISFALLDGKRVIGRLYGCAQALC